MKLLYLLYVFGSVLANEVNVGYLQLRQNVLQPKTRYVFSDFERNPDVDLLKDAFVDVNLAVHPHNYKYEKPTFIKLFIIIADSKNV